MRQKLFTIEDNFRLSGREGVIIAGELEDTAPPFKIGSVVVLVTPDDNELVTEINGVETVCRLNYENFNWKRVSVMLKDITKKEDVPIGTEVFLKM